MMKALRCQSGMLLQAIALAPDGECARDTTEQDSLSLYKGNLPPDRRLTLSMIPLPGSSRGLIIAGSRGIELTREDFEPSWVAPGQVWKRRDGSTVEIESRDSTHAWYWLQEGSHPQFRAIRIDRLMKFYTRIFPK